jgi:5-methylcytosine-specific restriction endonuclease McrA
MAKPNDQVIRYSILKAIRRIYQIYSLERKKAIERSTIKQPRRKLDGNVSKSYAVFRTCNACGKLCKDTERDIDHIDPVGPMPEYPFCDNSLEIWIRRLFCNADNLQVLCKECHKAKTARERKKNG